MGVSSIGGGGPRERDYFRTNNLDLMRLCLASAVFVHHLGGVSALDALEHLHISSLFAVQGFFVVSGFLVGKSYESSRSTWSFYEKRIRRVYPAYAFVVLATFLAFYGFSDAGFLEYLRNGLRYLFFQLTFMGFAQDSIPGIFLDNPLQVVNGSLWTLKIEMMFYAIVPFIMWGIRRFGSRGQFLVILGIYLASIAYRDILWHWRDVTGQGIYGTLAKQLPGQLSFFIVGIGCYVFFDQLKSVIWWLGPLAIGLVLWLDAGSVLRPLTLGLSVVYLGVFFPFLGNFGRYGDFSYGIYIWHFPLIQAAIALAWLPSYPVATSLGLAVSVVLMAVVSWRFVERPFLKRKSHYIEAEGHG